MAAPPLPVTGDPEADALLAENPFALLVGMLLDQQVPMERAFRSPALLAERLGGRLDATTVAATDPARLEELFRMRPALHRFPAAMARRTHELARHIVERYDGDPSAIWRTAGDAAELRRRLEELPGFGPEKARIFLAVLGKRFGWAPPGWETEAGPFGDATPRSVADVDGPEALERVRAFKRAQKAAGRTKAD